MNKEAINSKKELEIIADLLSKEISNSEDEIISRYTNVTNDKVIFINGKKITSTSDCNANTNIENRTKKTYNHSQVDILNKSNFSELKAQRELKTHRFQLQSKDIPLPTDEKIFMENIPSHINYFDNEFREFTKTHPNTRLTRNFVVEQKVIVNSKGGKAIQSTPFFEIYYSQGYQPITTNRSLGVICKSKEDIINLPKLIKYLPDPYPDKKIKKSKTFSEAFHNLFQISKLTHDSFEDAKIELKSLYDVIMLSGVPIHEIFGHHFEEPIGYLNFNDSMTFNIDQKIENKSIILEDNPKQEIEGYNVLGYTNFDAYGRKRETKTHIKDGKIHEFLGSEYGDLVKLNEIFNDKSFFGNATQDTVGTFPQPRMSCTVLKGETKPIDLEGKIVSVSHEGETNQRSKYYQATAYETYIIRNSIPERIVPIQVSGGINQALENITLLGDEIYQIGSCMKSDPIFQSNSSSVPVSQFVKSQLWKKQQVYPIKIKK